MTPRQLVSSSRNVSVNKSKRSENTDLVTSSVAARKPCSMTGVIIRRARTNSGEIALAVTGLRANSSNVAQRERVGCWGSRAPRLPSMVLWRSGSCLVEGWLRSSWTKRRRLRSWQRTKACWSAFALVPLRRSSRNRVFVASALCMITISGQKVVFDLRSGITSVVISSSFWGNAAMTCEEGSESLIQLRSLENSRTVT